jgi:hypothetical protein
MSGRGVFGVRGRKKELTQRALRRKSREMVALNRKNPPFIPQTSRDGAEFAKGAKDGAPSRSFVGWHNRRSKNTG